MAVKVAALHRNRWPPCLGMRNRPADGHSPDAARAKAIAAACLENGVLTAPTGVYGNTLRITPPLVITADRVDRALEGFGRAFGQAAAPP